MKTDLEKLIKSPLAFSLNLFALEFEAHFDYLNQFFSKISPNVPSHFVELCAPEASQLAYRFHTIKGGAGFLGLKSLEERAFKAKSLLEKLDSNTVNPISFKEDMLAIMEQLESDLKLLVQASNNFLAQKSNS